MYPIKNLKLNINDLAYDVYIGLIKNRITQVQKSLWRHSSFGLSRRTIHNIRQKKRQRKREFDYWRLTKTLNFMMCYNYIWCHHRKYGSNFVNSLIFDLSGRSLSTIRHKRYHLHIHDSFLRLVLFQEQASGNFQKCSTFFSLCYVINYIVHIVLRDRWLEHFFNI